jgi:hypothetical protein
MKVASLFYNLANNMTQLVFLIQTSQEQILTQEEFIILQQLLMIPYVSVGNTLEDKVNNLTTFYTKLYQGDAREKLPLNVQYTYAQGKAVLDKVAKN